jgi:hypothetical protein
MKFEDAIKNEVRETVTENGQRALNSTGNNCLDFFAVAGALRQADKDRITRLFEDAYNEDALLATKTLFYLRDVRGGLGERDTFRTILNYASDNHPEAIIKNLKLIAEFGRWDDLYSLVGTYLEDAMWALIKEQLDKDITNMYAKKPVSLLAKWLKTADASSENTRKQGINTAIKLGYKVYDYKRIIKALRKYIDVTEVKMSQNKWDEINYSAVPSKAMTNYRNAFYRHDEEGFRDYTNKVVRGEEKINASTLYPYDIIEKFIYYNMNGIDDNENKILNAQWNALPNYVEEGNVIVMADTSGSMTGRPLNTAISLAIYFAQRNTGAYHNLWMSFSRNPKFHKIKGKGLEQIIKSIDYRDWEMNTDLNKAMEKILEVAIKNHVAPEDLPKSLVVISDMEIDACTGELFHDHLVEMYEKAGYVLPNIIFWNVQSRHDTLHADAKRRGVQLVSGSSPSVFAHTMKIIDMTPVEAMLEILNSERYSCIEVA